MTARPIALMDCRPGDVIRIPWHHPALLRVDDIPPPAHWPDGLIPLAWSAVGDTVPGGPAEPDTGITSITMHATVELRHRPA